MYAQYGSSGTLAVFNFHRRGISYFNKVIVVASYLILF